jgi:predicted DNA-binding transcriptional regulator
MVREYMSKDQSIGAVVLVLCVAGILVYGCLVFEVLPGWSLLVLKLTGFIAILGILGIGAWIGWTMATTPPPKPIEELEKEIETEESAETVEEEKEKKPESIVTEPTKKE